MHADGPWLLDEAQLSELEREMGRASEEIDAAVESALDDAVERLRSERIQNEGYRRDRLGRGATESIDPPPLLPDRAEIRAELGQRHMYAHKRREFVIELETGQRVTCASLDDAKALPALALATPKRLTAIAERGKLCITLELEPAFSTNSRLTVRASPEDDEAVRAPFSRLLHWVEKSRPPRRLVWWQNYGRFSWLLLIAAFWVTLIFLQASGPTSQVRHAWRSEGAEILSAGINDENRDRAITAMLAIAVSPTMYPDGTVEAESSNNGPLWILLLGGGIACALLSIRPSQPHFEVGAASTRRVAAWRWYCKWLFLALPTWLLLSVAGVLLKAQIFAVL